MLKIEKKNFNLRPSAMIAVVNGEVVLKTTEVM